MIGWVALGVVAARWAASVWLAGLNRRHVEQHSGSVPPAFADTVDVQTYQRSVAYTRARNRLAQIAVTYGSIVLVVALFSGIVPAGFDWFVRVVGPGVWSMAGFLLVVAMALAALTLPIEWMARFRVEAGFGFNTSTQGTWWLDAAKRALLAVGLGYPVLALILAIVGWAGSSWWLWAWAAIMAVQLLVTVLAPFVILPLFNTLTPLPAGSLSDRLTKLADRTRFTARSIQVMDGSRRSRHSNAFFTGFGRLRRIVLFDTLIEQMEDPEIEAVLAHEIGHAKRRHVPKMLAASALGSAAALRAAAWAAARPEFVEAFGFSPAPATSYSASAVAPVLLLFGLLGGAVAFWFSPLTNRLLRRYEYQADAFALEAIGEPEPMISALRRLARENLSNLTPHPMFSRWHYSHPVLLEREAALRAEHTSAGA